jgi:hypothetical protein
MNWMALSEARLGIPVENVTPYWPLILFAIMVVLLLCWLIFSWNKEPAISPKNQSALLINYDGIDFNAVIIGEPHDMGGGVLWYPLRVLNNTDAINNPDEWGALISGHFANELKLKRGTKVHCVPSNSSGDHARQDKNHYIDNVLTLEVVKKNPR